MSTDNFNSTLLRSSIELEMLFFWFLLLLFASVLASVALFLSHIGWQALALFSHASQLGMYVRDLAQGGILLFKYYFTKLGLFCTRNGANHMGGVVLVMVTAEML